MRLKTIFLVVLFAAGLSTQGFSQTYPFVNYSIGDGLSESVVNDIIQDREGYIWLATGFGLNRFDGATFHQYFEEQGLINSKIYSLYEAADGKIWIGTNKGVSYFEKDSIYTIDALNALSNSRVISIFEDSSGDIWFGTDGEGVWQYYQKRVLDLYSTSQGFKSNQVRAIDQAPNGDIWFATRDGATRLSNGNLRTFTTKDGLPENRIRDLKIDNKGTIWLATRSGLTVYDGSEFITYSKEEGLNDPRIQTLEINDKGEAWMGTESGMSHFKNGSFKNFSTEQGLSNNIIHSTLIDREGNIWLGTFGGGESIFLGEYLENYSTANGLSNNLITSFAEDQNGDLWIASYGGGLMQFSGGEIHYLNQASGLMDDRVYHLSTDSKGRTWIGMRDGLAYLENDALANIKNSEFPFRKVRHVYEDENDTYWISTYDDGLIKMENGSYSQYTIEEGLPGNTVLASVKDENGDLWIATYAGVARLTNEGFISYTVADGLPNNAVMQVMKDKTGTIWVSTFGGIAWFDGVQFVDITEEDGLPDRVCYFLTQDRNGYIWVGTNGGIARLDVQKFYKSEASERNQGIEILTKDQGLISNEMNLGAVFEDKSGHLWFGTVEGLSHFYPDVYKGNSVPPEIHIEEIIASGKSYNSRNIKLPYSQNFIEIKFAGINFTAPDQVVYQYKMSNIDPDWQTTTSRTVRYPSLPSGEYTFDVRATNSSGVESGKKAIVDFVITPPFWQTWWFIGILIVIGVGIIYLFYRNYQYMQMVDIERMRVRIASDLHDDVGASLTEIALQSDFLQAGKLDPDFKQSIEQIGKQCRRIVTSLDDIVWSIDARNDTLGDFTDRMQDYVLNVLEPRNFNVSYDFDELNMENKLPVPVKENLYLIFKEAVNNISKYSNGDRVNLSMKSGNGKYCLKIFDNGTSGKGQKKTGHGLRNMEMRAERIGAEFNFEDTDGFTISVKGKLNYN